MTKTAIKGTIVQALPGGRLETIENGFLILENDGTIAAVSKTAPEDIPAEDFGNRLIMPSFADHHLHAPQYPMLGVGLDLPLLDWLSTYTFPTEARWEDTDYARAQARKLARALIDGGTTRVAMFSTMHRPATLALMDELEKAGVTGYVGKVNMDRNGGARLEETTEESIQETLAWLDACDFEHIKPILTPRFTPSCTDRLMDFLGRLAAERDLPVQSHLSENTSEVSWVQELTGCDAYWQSYDRHGLWNSKTLMAHCVWSDADERAAMKAAGVLLVHCAASNNNLTSGLAPVRAMLDEGLHVVLGSDIGAGDTYSGFDMVRDTVNTGKNRRIYDDFKTAPVSIPEAYAMAQDASFFGAGPGFSPGDLLHAVVLDDSALDEPWPLSTAERLERAAYRRQPGAVTAVYSAGRRVK